MRRKKRASDDGGTFLAGTESALSDFGQSAGDGFAEAWNAHDPQAGADDAGSFAHFDDKRSARSRDLDRRWRRGPIVVAALLLGVAAAVVVQQDLIGGTTATPAEGELPALEIVGITQDRPYVDSAGPATADSSALADQRFEAPTSDDDPRPVPMPDDGEQALFGRFLWGGRAHVSVLASDLDLTKHCVVASLVSDDLRVVDLAAAGDCTSDYVATGDRTACVGDDIIVLEVWPFDPDAVVEQAEVTALRVRIEARDPTSGAVTSQRGAIDIDSAFTDRLAIITGRPGDDAELRVGRRSGFCTLLDRAEVPVQLL